MEARVITIIMESSNGFKTINTGAETLGQLKADLSAAGIDYSGKTFREGITRTELIDDTSALPRDVVYRGEKTNNLVFTLLTTDKKIKSGAMTRAEAYEAVKEFGLQDAIKLKFGKNFTQVGTVELENFIQNSTPAVEAPAPSKAEVAMGQVESPNCAVVEAVRRLVDVLEYNDYLDLCDAEEIRGILNGSKPEVSQEETLPLPWSKADLDNFRM